MGIVPAHHAAPAHGSCPCLARARAHVRCRDPCSPAPGGSPGHGSGQIPARAAAPWRPAVEGGENRRRQAASAERPACREC